MRWGGWGLTLAWGKVVHVRNESSTPKLWRNPLEATGRGSMARQRWKKRDPCLSPKLGGDGRGREGQGGMEGLRIVGNGIGDRRKVSVSGDWCM